MLANHSSREHGPDGSYSAPRAKACRECLAHTPPRLGAPPVNARPAGSVIRVIVVDDHRMFAESVARILSDETDIDVVAVVNSGDAGVTMAAHHQPDVAVIDYRLPDGDGASVARKIRTANPAIQIVMLTGLDDDRLVVAAIEAGCAAFLTKDKASGELVTAIRLASSGEAYISPAVLAGLLRRMDGAHRGLGSDLTPREREVLDLLAQALTNQAIADRLVVSVHTVRNHVQNILMKLSAHSKLEAVTVAARAGLLRSTRRGSWPS
jgi:two-component system, NarL family, response regulator DevR